MANSSITLGVAGQPDPGTTQATQKNDQASTESTQTRRLPNQLEIFSSFNCIFTLACLTPDEINYPEQTYRINPPAVTVLRSGGGAINKALTAYETSNAQLEYFITDVEIETIIAPTTATRSSNAIGIRFKVIEPYSMGLFLQTLQVAAKNALGTSSNYNRACYALVVEFIGFDDDGNVVHADRAKRIFPFKIVNVEFHVSGSGSEYAVEAIAWNEQAQSQTNQTVNVDIQIQGSTVSEMLQTGTLSLTNVLNKRIQEKYNQGTQVGIDEYVILFPKELSDVSSNLLNQASTQEAGLTEDNEAFIRGISGVGSESRIQGVESAAEEISPRFNTVSDTASNISSSLVDYAQNTELTNEIGKSRFTTGISDGGSTPFGIDRFSYRDETGVYDNRDVVISSDYRTFTFPQGTTIEKIIEEVVISSFYGQDAVNKLDTITGNLPWFRIQTSVYISPNKEQLARTGEYPKIIVYSVIPYYVHSSVFKSLTTGSVNILNRKEQVVKEYNYIYTGLNKDIVDFKIELKNTFYNALNSGGYDGAADVKVRSSEGAAITKEQHVAPAEGQQGMSSSTGIARVAEDYRISTGQEGGSGNDNIAIQVARQFNDAIVNSNVDLITLEMTVLGDPYYLSDSGAGNYTSPISADNTFTNDDGTMNYQNGEVDVLINFRTPIDYNQTGTMTFPEDTMAVQAFSGLYKLIIVRNRFGQNQFEQVLEMIRRPSQDTDFPDAGNPGKDNRIIADADKPSDQNTAEAAYGGEL